MEKPRRKSVSRGKFKRGDAEALSYLSLRLRALALNHFERKNDFLHENLAVSEILCIFACNYCK